MAPSILSQKNYERVGKSPRPKHKDEDFSIVISSMTPNNFNAVSKKKVTKLNNNEKNFHTSHGDSDQS